MDLAERISAIVAPSLEAMGYDLVRVLLQGNRRRTLQIMAERRDGVAMSVDDCAAISRSVSALLDVEDPIPDAYMLEVSSPGLDRPLTRPQDYERFAGCEANIETARPLDGRKRFRGKLLGLDGEGRLRLVADTGEWTIPLAEVARARLVPTDETITADLRRQEQ